MPMRTTLVRSPMLDVFRQRDLRIGILHSGGPAPGGNLVFYAAALRAKDYGIPMIAFKHGYSELEKVGVSPSEIMARAGMPITRAEIRYLRDQLGLVAGTARANPATYIDQATGKEKKIASPEELSDPYKTAKLAHVLAFLEAEKIGALISVGGDDTMKTANLLQALFQLRKGQGVPFENFQGVVHVPKTIDKDYLGIDFTFGFMSAAQKAGSDIRDFHADAKATGVESQPVYHVVEVMGRAAGWLTAAAAVYGQATYAIVPEDYIGRSSVTIEELAKDCVDVILSRRQDDKHYGVIAISEGLAELLPKVSDAIDAHGHTRLDEQKLSTRLTEAIKAELKLRGSVKVKLQDQKVGYSTRQVEPNIFDTLLCFRLGVSAVDGILTDKFGHMVSVQGVFSPRFVPFQELIDPVTLKVRNWVMGPDEGLYQLMVAMQAIYQTDVNLPPTGQA